MLAAGVVLFGLVMGAATASAQSGAVYRKYKGQLVISGDKIAVDSDDDDATFRALKAVKPVLERREGSRRWDFYFIAFLSKKTGKSDLSLLFYEKGKKDMKFYKDIAGVDPNANIIAFDELDFNEDDDGVKPGTTYDVVLAHVNGKKITSFAKGRVTFK